MIACMLMSAILAQAPVKAVDSGPKVVITQPDESKFPQIQVYFELRNPDGSFVRDANRGDFRVTEDGQDRPILGFDSPVTVVTQPTTIVLVLDRSGSMREDDKITSLKRAVMTFLDGLPEGSKIAVLAFGSDLRVVCPFTTDLDQVRNAVTRIEPGGATRYFDAVDRALQLLEEQSGRRAVLAMTDGQDTESRLTIKQVITRAQKLNLPVHTLGLGEGDSIDTKSLDQLAEKTRGQSYRARDADSLKVIYQELAERLGSTYSLTYQTDRKIPDGTLRPIKLFYAKSESAAESAVFIPGMVVPAPGWSRLFLLLIGGLGFLAMLPQLGKSG
jgi:VWFA-related protein